MMYFDEPAPAFQRSRDSAVEGAADRACGAVHLAGRLVRAHAARRAGRRRPRRRCSEPATIRTVAETGSTNADMIALAASGLEEGVWLRAERQTGGRGRQGRAWVSPPGNLYASTLVRLRPSDPPAATLALVAAVALEEAVGAYLPGAARAQMAQRPADRRRQAVGHPARTRRRCGGDRLRRQPGASSRPIPIARRPASPRTASRSIRPISSKRSPRPSPAGSSAGAGRARAVRRAGSPRASDRHRAHRAPARRRRSTGCSTGSTGRRAHPALGGRHAACHSRRRRLPALRANHAARDRCRQHQRRLRAGSTA